MKKQQKIFITEQDVFHQNLPVYTVERVVLETGELFRDGGHILYANGAYTGTDRIGQLMADFRETDPDRMHFPSLAEKARYYKTTEGGLEHMGQFAEELIAEGRAEGRREERIRARKEMLRARKELRYTRHELVRMLLKNETARNLLHHPRYRKLHITEAEIQTVKDRYRMYRW